MPGHSGASPFSTKQLFIPRFQLQQFVLKLRGFDPQVGASSGSKPIPTKPTSHWLMDIQLYMIDVIYEKHVIMTQYIVNLM